MIETTPTYKRTNEFMKAVNSQTQALKPAMPPAGPSEPQVAGNVIVF